MRSLLLKRALGASFSRSAAASTTLAFSLPSSLHSSRNAVSKPVVDEEAETVVLRPREGPGISHGLNWALARKGVIVKDKVFRNLNSSELQQKGATVAGSLSGLPLHVRGNVLGGPEVSKANFFKLLKQVTGHISSVSNIFVHDGAIGSSSKCDAKVRVISDCPSAALSFLNILWKTPTRAVSHDPCPLTVYVATSISPSPGDAIGLNSQGSNGFIAADIERSSVILCGKAFSDTNGIKEALVALSEPIISAREGLPLSARLLLLGDSAILLFASEDIIQSCSSSLVSADGVILASQGVAPFFQTTKSGFPNLFKLPDAVILASSDRSGVIPPVAKLTPGQVGYHFLAGYQDGKFVPAYNKGPSSIDPLDLAMSLSYKLKDDQISSFLINVNGGEKRSTSNDLIKLMQSAIAKNVPPFQPKAGDLQGKMKNFLSGRFQEMPEELSF